MHFSKERLVAQFTELLRAYKAFHLTDFSNEGDEDTPAAAQKPDLEDAASVAWDTFRAAFKNQALLTKDYLLQQEEKTVLDNMSSWVDYSLPQAFYRPGDSLYVHKTSVTDVVACSNLVEQLTSESANKSVATNWPYIERVKY